MQVVINRDPKLSKIDHLFVVLAENCRPELPISSKSLKKLLDDSGFVGRADESITVLADEPKKITLIGLGKEEALTIAALRGGLYAHREDREEAARRATSPSSLPYAIPELTRAETTRVIADYLAQRRLQVRRVHHRQERTRSAPPITRRSCRSTASTRSSCKRIETEAQAIADGVRTVRDLGNAPRQRHDADAARRARRGSREGDRREVHGLRQARHREDEDGRPARRQPRLGRGAALRRPRVRAEEGARSTSRWSAKASPSTPAASPSSRPRRWRR